MARVQVRDFSKEERMEMVGELFDIVSQQKNTQEAVKLLVGLLSPSEILMISRRIHIAQLLLEGKSYRAISTKIGVSEATVSAVARLLFGEDCSLKRKIEKYTKNQSKKTRKKNYRNILSPYGQLQILKDLLNV